MSLLHWMDIFASSTGHAPGGALASSHTHHPRSLNGNRTKNATTYTLHNTRETPYTVWLMTLTRADKNRTRITRVMINATNSLRQIAHLMIVTIALRMSLAQSCIHHARLFSSLHTESQEHRESVYCNHKTATMVLRHVSCLALFFPSVSS
jgi:hypothetical protein